MVHEENLIKKILVALDGSIYSKKVAKYGGDLALRYEAEITLINVVEPPNILMPISGMETTMPMVEIELKEKLIQRTESKAKEMLEEYKQILESKGLDVTLQIETGNVSDTILRTAEDQNYDLIVVGSRGLGDIKRFFLGSDSDKISKHAHCPVLIVR